MAYTNSPENSTYKTVNMEFTATNWRRDLNYTSDRDPEIVNMFYDRNSNENQTRDFVLKKRSGLVDSSKSLNKSSSTDIINGIYQDSNSGYIYWSVNNKVYRYDGFTNILLGTMGGTTPTTTNSVGFCMFLKSTGVRYLMVNNGSQLWYHDLSGVALTQVVDADYPGTTSPHMVFLDGYLFVVKTNTGDIYNSDLDDPTSWTAGNYVTAEINPDFALTISKVKNYLVCFGNDGVEFFYDAANPQGSPLARNESYYKPVILQSSVCNIGDTLYFMGRFQNQMPRMFKLDGNSLDVISPSWVNRFLERFVITSFLNPTVTSANFIANFSSMGHNFLVVNTNSNFILLYDLEENFWYRWNFGTTSALNRIEGACKDPTTPYRDFLIQGGLTTFSAIDDFTYQDFGVNFTCSYITEDVTQETFNWKSCHRLGLFCDYPTTSGTSYAQISWSDDDGNTWSSLRNMLVTTNNPYITQCGRFRSRNWKIEYTDNYPFRFWGISMDLNVGNI